MSSALVEEQGFIVPIGTHKGKNIAIGSDHRGFELKKNIVDYLHSKGYVSEPDPQSPFLIDVGCRTVQPCNYPQFAKEIADMLFSDALNEDPFSLVGIGVCGSGIGMAIVASKYQHVYPARCLSVTDAESSRIHNNSNYLALSADQTSPELAFLIVDKWLATAFFRSPEDKRYYERFVQTLRIEREVCRGRIR